MDKYVETVSKMTDQQLLNEYQYLDTMRCDSMHHTDDQIREVKDKIGFVLMQMELNEQRKEYEAKKKILDENPTDHNYGNACATLEAEYKIKIGRTFYIFRKNRK